MYIGGTKKDRKVQEYEVHICTCLDSLLKTQFKIDKEFKKEGMVLLSMYFFL